MGMAMSCVVMGSWMHPVGCDVLWLAVGEGRCWNSGWYSLSGGSATCARCQMAAPCPAVRAHTTHSPTRQRLWLHFLNVWNTGLDPVPTAGHAQHQKFEALLQGLQRS